MYYFNALLRNFSFLKDFNEKNIIGKLLRIRGASLQVF